MEQLRSNKYSMCIDRRAAEWKSNYRTVTVEEKSLAWQQRSSEWQDGSVSTVDESTTTTTKV